MIICVSSYARLRSSLRKSYQKNQSQYISHEQAAQAAVAQVTGGQAGDVDFEYNPWRGAHFDVEVYGQNGEYDVIVDAKTGKVLSVRRDY